MIRLNIQFAFVLFSVEYDSKNHQIITFCFSYVVHSVTTSWESGCTWESGVSVGLMAKIIKQQNEKFNKMKTFTVVFLSFFLSLVSFGVFACMCLNHD